MDADAITQVIERNDLEIIAEQAGAHFERSGGELRSACPLHGGDNESAFVLYRNKANKQMWTCFTGCGTGDIIDFVMKWKDTDFVGALEYLSGSLPPTDNAEWVRVAAERAEQAAKHLEDSIAAAQVALDNLRAAQRWIAYHQNLDALNARALWDKRGINKNYQDYWNLGFCPTFTAWKREHGEWVSCTSSTLTIPVFDEQWQVQQVRHRLMNPSDPDFRYRPEQSGLPAAPFIAYPDKGYDAERIVVVEGEIKAAVFFQTIYLQGDDLQVIGIPGKKVFHELMPKLKGKNTFVLFDPDGMEQSIEAAKMVGGRVMSLPVKVDDAINAGYLTRRDLLLRMKSARKV